jgi:transposase
LPIKVWTADESRFGLLTTRRQRLTLRGIKPLAICQHDFDTTYLYGAVAPLAGESVFLELPYLDTEHFQIFLDYFASRYPESLNLMVLDNGGYHTTPKLRRPEQIRFVFTPPYTPEVSPIERVFEDVKDKVTAEVYQSLDELSESLCGVIQAYTPERLSSLTGYPFFREGAKAVSVGL